MKYYNLTAGNVYDKPILFKVNKKSLNIARKMAKLARQHAKLDRQFIEELAKVNNIETFEVSDILAAYDFLVEMTEYGNAIDCYAEWREISKAEYIKLSSQTEVENEK